MHHSEKAICPSYPYDRMIPAIKGMISLSRGTLLHRRFAIFQYSQADIACPYQLIPENGKSRRKFFIFFTRPGRHDEIRRIP
jgi:hypothetical protein